MNHSIVVGGSTAKRVIACPGSVALVQQAPVLPSSTYADQGTLLHTVISEVLDTDCRPEDLLGTKYEGQILDQQMLDDKINPALDLLNKIDPNKLLEFDVEIPVAFGKYLPDAFGSCDLLGRIGGTTYVLDWKFGDGIAVSAEENEQLMFYAAAAMRTPNASWAFEGATEIVCVIIQPPVVRQWRTTPERIKQFERQLKKAVKHSARPDAKLHPGDHCRFCPAKPTCPAMTGAVDRALKVKLAALDNNILGAYASNAVLLQGWIEDLNKLVQAKLEAGDTIPGWKLVAKQGRRQWVDEQKTVAALTALGVEPYKKELISPAQAEKKTKNLPDDLVVSVSSGNTLAPESDPRPAVVLLGRLLSAALSKLN